jgi:hypothetical protein
MWGEAVMVQLIQDKKNLEDIQSLLSEFNDVLKKYNLWNEYRFNKTLRNLNVVIDFGIEVNPDGLTLDEGHIPLSGFASFRFMDNDHRSISWSDDGRQPVNEWLYVISFSSGPYIFHRDVYLKEYFIKFFNELKAFEPEYSDTANWTLYFNKENAAAVHKALPVILQRYKDETKEAVKEQEIRELEAKLNKLKG